MGIADSKPLESRALPSQVPLLVYDGECGFCMKWVRRWQRLLGDRLEYAPYQEVATRFPEIGTSAFEQALHLIEPSGRVSRGAEAVFRSLALNHGYRWLLWLYLRSSIARYITEKAYRFVAEHRMLVSRLTAWF